MSETQAEYNVIDRRMQETPALPVQAEPNAVIMAAIQKNMSPEFISKLMDLQERHEANEAKKAYHVAMGRFKATPPEIDKDRHVKFQTTKGTTEYFHASLANVTKKIAVALASHGLSASWKTEQGPEGIKVTCSITHEMGHAESTSLIAKPDDSGGKNAIQAVGSTVSYLERYTILALTGLATHDMDDDGKGSGAAPEYITEKQLSQIVDMINDKNIDEAAFLTFMKAEAANRILSKDFKKAVDVLQKAKGKPAREPGSDDQ